MAYQIIEDVAPMAEYYFLASLGILAAQDVVQIDREGRLIGRGEFMELPRIDEPSDPQRRDYSTTGATRSFTEMSTSLEKAPIMRDDVANQYLETQVDVSGANFQTWWLMRAGLKLARRAKQQIYRMASASVEVVTDDAHISDVYSNATQATMTFSRLQTARALLGDASGLLNAAVMHSHCWDALVKDGLTNYKVDNVAGRIIQTGGIQDASLKRLIHQNNFMRVATCDSLGMVIFIDDDAPVVDMTGSTYTYKTKYETLLFGPGAVILSYQRMPKPNIVLDIDDARGSVVKLRQEIDYALKLTGISWNSATSNPTDAQLGTKSNWTTGYSDHREVLCVKLITN